MQQLSTECVDLAREGQERYIPKRGYLGASILGDDARVNWLRFRMSWPEEFPGRMLRLFDLGRVIEDDVISSLKAVEGVEVNAFNPETGQQWRVKDFGGHLSGSCDGFIRGFPGTPPEPGVLEVKSMNARRFKDWQANGMEKTNVKYWVQGQMYCRFFGRPYVLFVVYNKDTSELGAELAMASQSEGDAWTAHAQRIIFNHMELPAPGWQKREEQGCRLTMQGEAARIYWGDQLPRPNCRNCRHSRPLPSGGWACEMHGQTWDGLELYYGGCNYHNFIPALVNAEKVNEGPTWVQYLRTGKVFWNCARDIFNLSKRAFSSDEMAELSKLGYVLADDPAVKAFSEMFDAKVESVTPVWELSDPDVV